MAWLERGGHTQREAASPASASTTSARASLRILGLAAAALLGLAVMAPATGCSDTEKIPGEKCVGGIIDDEGNCLAKCDPEKCLEGNVCVDNVCRLKCTAHDDCYLGVQACAPALTDPDAGGDQQEVTVCLENGHAPILTNGYPAGWYGTGCVGGDGDCAMQLGCPNGLECDPASCGDCELDEAACEGKELCNVGKCASSGERCTFNTCPLDQCTPFLCLDWVGEGDTEAYCTNTDCSDDANCPDGFYCGAKRDPRDVCNSDTGGGNICGGPSNAPCVDPAAPPPGGQYLEGSVCLMQRTCLRRDECAPCETNLDCSLGPADVCANHFEQTVCARFCLDNGDCAPDEECLGYVAASGTGGQTCAQSPNVDCVTGAECPVEGDVCVPRSVCVPRTGACDGSNQPAKFCVHCTDDTHCGPPGSGWACTEQSNGHTACLDLGFTTSCTSNADCPQVPNGTLRGKCLDESDGVQPGNPVYQKCYFPRTADGYVCF